MRMGSAIALLCVSLLCHAGAIVTSPSCTIGNVADTETARLLFLGKLSSVSGQTVTIVWQQPDYARAEFESKVMGTAGARLSSEMAKLIYAGEARPPLLVYDDNNVKTKVNAVMCAIGFVSDSAVDDTVKVVLRY